LFFNGIDMGPGPGVGMTVYEPGTYVLSGAVPETSTWAMMLLSFAGLGLAGYRRVNSGKPTPA
jgi:hypothetical protein